MLGHRGTTNGDEYDAFSRRVRAMLRWKRGVLGKIKRGHNRKMRRKARHALRGAEEE
jgi:hypothetical protein